MRLIALLLPLISIVYSQYTSQTYPDPRLDPLSCRLAVPSIVCDPSGVLADEERGNLIRKLAQLQAVTANIRNTSPSCALQPDKKLEILVAVIDKIGTMPGSAVDIEKFANNLKRRYQNFQDIGMCDTTVLIVNSRQDRQVFTVAGRDARIAKETLKSAFDRNIVHFKSGRYALGVEGMIEIIVSAYANSHIVQVPTPELFRPDTFAPPPSAETPFRAAGLPNSVQPAKKPFQPLATEEVEEKDAVWISIMQQAMSRCGQDTSNLGQHVRAVVEEAMAVSLKLISDTRYNSIEEEVDTYKDVVGIRGRAWDKAQNEFILPLFNKYKNTILANSNQVCPAVSLKALRRL